MERSGRLYLPVSHHQNPIVDFVRDLIVAVAGHEGVELGHACLVGGFFVLLLLVLDAFCDARHDRNGDDNAAQKYTKGERHVWRLWCSRGTARGSGGYAGGACRWGTAGRYLVDRAFSERSDDVTPSATS